MSKDIKKVDIEFPENWDAFLAAAASEDDSCASVGGLYVKLGLVKEYRPPSPRVFGLLVEYARRTLRLTVEDLARKADVDLADLVAIEQDGGAMPDSTTVCRLAETLNLPADKLMELVGLSESRDERLSVAVLRFAARSETNARLTKEEQEAFEEFVKVLVEG